MSDSTVVCSNVAHATNIRLRVPNELLHYNFFITECNYNLPPSVAV
jgi:hypothetical protein